MAAKRKGREDPIVKVEVDNYNRIRRNHDSLLRRKLTSLFEVSREDCFATLVATCLENQHTGQKEPVGPSKPTFRFSEREELARLLFPSPTPTPTPTPTSYEKQIEDSCQIIRAYASLCGRGEYPRPRHQPEQAGQDPPESLDVGDVTDIKPCFLDTEPDMYPLLCPGTQCLFCLGDVSLAPNIRTRCFANPFTLTRHVHKQHLGYLPRDQRFVCPHPSMAFFLTTTIIIRGMLLTNTVSCTARDAEMT